MKSLLQLRNWSIQKIMNKKKSVQLTIDIIIIAILTLIDQYTKKLASLKLKDKPAFPIIDGVFELHYLENRGAAFGMLQNQKIMFIIIACIMLIFVSYTLYKLPAGPKFILFEICMLLMSAGAIGNLIDRAGRNYVVDFFYFILINFPIFNVADIYVTVSCAILIILILFVYKDTDLDFLKIKKNGTI